MSVYSITRFGVLTNFLRHKLGKHFLLNVNVYSAMDICSALLHRKDV